MFVRRDGVGQVRPDSYDCLLVVFFDTKHRAFRDPGFAPRHFLAVALRSGPLSNAPLKETCDLRVSGVSAESPMTHEFLHDAKASPLVSWLVRKDSPGRIDNATNALLITLSRGFRK